jgi:hypothetical protein
MLTFSFTRTATLFLVSMALALKGSAQCGDPSNTHSFSYDGNSYDIVKTSKTWSDAADCALQKGGHLVHINDQAEQDTLYQRIIDQANVSPGYTSVNDGGGIAYVWIGANDMASEGSWVWDGDGDSSGTQFWQGQGSAGNGGGNAVNGNFYYWGGSSSGSANEPDDYNSQNAAGIALGNWPYGSPSEWNDIDASNSLYFVVEYENASSLDSREESQKDRLKIRPNPVENKLRWESARTNITAYRILDPSGRIVLEGSSQLSSEGRIDASGLGAGIYFLKLRNEEGRSLVRRFVKKK